MTLKQHFELLAQYNQWLNEKLYSLCIELPDDQLIDVTSLHHCSIFGLLQAAVQLDQQWLARFASHPAGFVALLDLRQVTDTGMPETQQPDLSSLWRLRNRLDQRILALCDELEVCHLAYPLVYENRQHNRFEKRFGYLLQHLFNQQTLARGGLIIALQQQGIVPDTTELLAVIPEA
ncbi:DinB family protein [Pontibacter sp. JAM-7]|uniref:DinB family protein n=1 Tax=Pontibacter sp. JAM-7 TaxID=3366581 RepID=UPI003AF6CFD1